MPTQVRVHQRSGAHKTPMSQRIKNTQQLLQPFSITCARGGNAEIRKGKKNKSWARSIQRTREKPSVIIKEWGLQTLIVLLSQGSERLKEVLPLNQKKKKKKNELPFHPLFFPYFFYPFFYFIYIFPFYYTKIKLKLKLMKNKRNALQTPPISLFVVRPLKL